MDLALQIGTPLRKWEWHWGDSSVFSKSSDRRKKGRKVKERASDSTASEQGSPGVE